MREQMPTPRWLRKSEACGYLGCSTRTLERLLAAGKLRASYALGVKSPRWDSHDLDRLMESGDVSGADGPDARLAVAGREFFSGAAAADQSKPRPQIQGSTNVNITSDAK
jgi:excisionase family DNA binding protein